MIKKRFPLVFLFLIFLAASCPAYADVGSDLGLVLGGAANIFASVLQLPFSILQNSMVAFPFGMIAGAVDGTMRAVGGTLVGAVSMAQGAAPYAKYAALFV